MIKSCTCICKGRQDEVRHSLKADSEKHPEMPRTGFEPVTTCTNVHHIYILYMYTRYILSSASYMYMFVLKRLATYMLKSTGCPAPNYKKYWSGGRPVCRTCSATPAKPAVLALWLPQTSATAQQQVPGTPPNMHTPAAVPGGARFIGQYKLLVHAVVGELNCHLCTQQIKHHTT